MSAIPVKPADRKNKGKMGPPPTKLKNHKYYTPNIYHEYLRRGFSTSKRSPRHISLSEEIVLELQEFVKFAKDNKLNVHFWSTGHVIRPTQSSVIAKALELFLLQYSPNLWEWPPHTFDPTAEDPFHSI